MGWTLSSSAPYAYACAEAWYRVDIQENSYFDPDTYQLYTFTVAYADALVEQNKAVEIASVVSTYKNRPCLGLFCITYLYIPQDVYPALAVEEVTQGKISLPVVEGEGYTYSFSLFFEETFGNLACQFVVYGGDYSLEEQYFDLLLFSDFALCRVNEGDDTVEENLYEYPGIEWGCYYMAYLSHYAVVFYYSFDVNGLSVEVYNLQPQD
ncbi:MAG: hypothetical protein SOV58_04755 [Candidatus Enteromonas sp.]|nr:hypothetical protein [Candidatus Enteromonas sp.]